MAERETYAIEGGQEGKRRLDVLAQVMRPHTTALLDRVGVRAGARCVDVGCGGGHVSLELARRVGPAGAVVGVDFDAAVVELAAADATAAGIEHVEFRCGAATAPGCSDCDLAYARFLLSHVDDPGAVVEAMAAVLRPGGVVVVEDVDFTGGFSHPPSPAYTRYMELYRETVRRRGGDADIGLRLPALLRDAGLVEIGMSTCQPCGFEGDAKRMSLLTLERIADAVVAEGVAPAAEVAETLAALRELNADPASIMGLPRIVQAWGSLPAAAGVRR